MYLMRFNDFAKGSAVSWRGLLNHPVYSLICHTRQFLVLNPILKSVLPHHRYSSIAVKFLLFSIETENTVILDSAPKNYVENVYRV